VGIGSAYENVDVLAQRAVRVRFYDFLDGAAGIQRLRHLDAFRARLVRVLVGRVGNCAVSMFVSTFGLTCHAGQSVRCHHAST
jgi:hypothetical protein